MTGTDFIPRARIESRPATEQTRSFYGIDTVYVVLDEKGEWGTYGNYAAAKERLKIRRSVEKAMRTRRENKARRARLAEARREARA